MCHIHLVHRSRYSKILLTKSCFEILHPSSTYVSISIQILPQDSFKPHMPFKGHAGFSKRRTVDSTEIAEMAVLLPVLMSCLIFKIWSSKWVIRILQNEIVRNCLNSLFLWHCQATLLLKESEDLFLWNSYHLLFQNLSSTQIPFGISLFRMKTRQLFLLHLSILLSVMEKLWCGPFWWWFGYAIWGWDVCYGYLSLKAEEVGRRGFAWGKSTARCDPYEMR
jgi:hypothetical protein